MTHPEKPNQHSLLLEWLRQHNGIATTNEMRDLYKEVSKYQMADACARARDLERDKLLAKRWITDEEKQQLGYKAKVKVFYIPQPQLTFYPEQKEKSGCPPPELTENKLHFYFPDGLKKPAMKG